MAEGAVFKSEPSLGPDAFDPKPVSLATELCPGLSSLRPRRLGRRSPHACAQFPGPRAGRPAGGGEVRCGPEEDHACPPSPLQWAPEVGGTPPREVRLPPPRWWPPPALYQPVFLLESQAFESCAGSGAHRPLGLNSKAVAALESPLLRGRRSTWARASQARGVAHSLSSPCQGGAECAVSLRGAGLLGSAGSRSAPGPPHGGSLTQMTVPCGVRPSVTTC